MRRLRVWLLRVGGMFRKERRDSEFIAELASHLQMHIEDNVHRGMTPELARRAALLKLGGIEQTRENYRDRRGLPWLGAFSQDLRYTFRRLRKDRAFALTAILILALGIGANTAIFSVIHRVLLKPMPYKEADRLVMVWEQNPHRGWFENIVSAANFLDWEKQNHVFTEMAAFESNYFNLTGENKPEEVSGERVTTNLFSVLGVRPFRGRLFLPEEEKRGNAAVVLSYGLWQERYGGDPALVGKAISVNGERLTVVGILPASFTDDYSSSFAPRSRLWASGLGLEPEFREFHQFHAIARLRAGVSLRQAQAEMDTIANRIEQQCPESKGWGVALVQLHDQAVETTRPALLVLLCAVGLVLVIACANVADLSLVRATKREKEIAIRTALGASRRQIVRQLLIESTLISLLGAAVGLVLAGWGSQILARLSPPGTLQLEGASIDGMVLLFAVVVALGTGIAFGLAPALQATKTQVSEGLKEGGRGFDLSAKRGRLRDALVVCEFGLALTLLFGAGLMIRALAHLNRVEVGFDPENVVTMKVPLKGPRYEDQRNQAQFFQQLVARIEALPGVQAASVSRGVPMDDWAGWDFVTADNPNPPAGEVPDANYIVIGPDYFRALGIPLRAGRTFSETDTPAGQRVAIVSESLAQKYWPDENPIGKRLKIGSDASDPKVPWLSVVGVAGSVKSQGQFAPFVPEIYVPYTQYPWTLSPRQIVVRTASSPAGIVEAIRQQVAALDTDVPISEVSAMKEVVAGRIRQEQTVMLLLGVFAALALVLAGIGIYSVVSCAVTQRTHEIGIRVALGASQPSITQMVVRQGLVLAGIGVALGLAGALVMTRVLSSLPGDVRVPLLFDVRPFDPPTLTSVSVILVVVALGACYVPARRASRVDPMVALRHE
jgi:putative ABC transport system permease protein